MGIINTAIKGELADKESYNEAVHVMKTLNKYAKEALDKVKINAVTDITGFGLLGHGLEMAEGSNVSIKIYHDRVPLVKKYFRICRNGLSTCRRLFESWIYRR